MIRLYFAKRPAEVELCQEDFSSELPSGVTISSATLAARDLTNDAVDNTFLVSTTGSIAGGVVSGKVTDGVNGRQYEVVLTANLSDGQVKQRVQIWHVTTEI